MKQTKQAYCNGSSYCIYLGKYKRSEKFLLPSRLSLSVPAFHRIHRLVQNHTGHGLWSWASSPSVGNCTLPRRNTFVFVF